MPAYEVMNAPNASSRDGGSDMRQLGRLVSIAAAAYTDGYPTYAAFQLGRVDQWARAELSREFYKQVVKPWIDDALEFIATGETHDRR